MDRSRSSAVFQSCKSRCGSNVYIEEDILENSFPGIDDFSCVCECSLFHFPIGLCRYAVCTAKSVKFKKSVKFILSKSVIIVTELVVTRADQLMCRSKIKSLQVLLSIDIIFHLSIGLN